MRAIHILAVLLVISLKCLCQERLKIDVDTTVTKTRVVVTSRVGMGPTYPHPPSVWRVDLSTQLVDAGGNTRYEVRIVNVSNTPQTLPLHQDGVSMVSECKHHSVLEGGIYLERKNDAKYLKEVGRFYGCESFPASLMEIKPGEWVTYVRQFPVDRGRSDVRANFNFGRTRYIPVPGGQTSEELEPSAYGSSPWVQVGESPAAVK